MLAVNIPPDAGLAARVFLLGWSNCMQAMMVMTEKDKKLIQYIFKDIIAPQAHCPEMKALDDALITYLLHECDSPEAVGSAIPKAGA
jgi:hypothetical protein